LNKAWGFDYVTKEDKEPYVWGLFSLPQIMEEALASTKKKAGLLKARPLKMGDVLNRLRNHKEWSHVLKDPELQRHLWAKHNVVQELWYHLNRESRKLQSMAETGPPDSFVVYPFPARKAWELQLYTPPEKSFFIDWLAVNRVVGGVTHERRSARDLASATGIDSSESEVVLRGILRAADGDPASVVHALLGSPTYRIESS